MITTTATLIGSLYGTNEIRFARGFASVTPPKAPVSTPISEIPICTVDKNSLGSSIKSITIWAFLFPSSKYFCIFAFLTDTTANSAIDKYPVRIIKINIITISIISPAISNRP